MNQQPTILFVDDEINILNSLKRGLIDEDYDCIFTTSPEKALEILENQTVNVIVSDMRMPGMNGLEFLKIVKDRWPKTVRIVLSGYAQLSQVVVTINQADIFRFILKPWKLNGEFLDTLEAAVRYNRLQVEREELEKTLKRKNDAYQNILSKMNEAMRSSKKHAELRARFMELCFQLMISNIQKNEAASATAAKATAIYDFLRLVDGANQADQESKPFLQWLERVQSDFKQGECNVNACAGALGAYSIATPGLYEAVVRRAIEAAAGQFADPRIKFLPPVYLPAKQSAAFSAAIAGDGGGDAATAEFVISLAASLAQFIAASVSYKTDERGLTLLFELPVS